MSISARCPSCSAVLRVKDEMAGRKVRCPECDTRFLVEDDDQAAEVVRPGKPKAGKTSLGTCLGGTLTLLLVCGGCFGIYGWISGRAADDLKEADRLYAAGSKAEAIAKYKPSYGFATNKTEVLKRIVDFEIAKGDTAEARRWVEKGVSDKLDVAYDSEGARVLLADLKREQEARLAKKKAEEEARAKEREARDRERKGKEAERDRVQANRDLPRGELRNRIVGMSPNELIAFLGKPDRTQELGGQPYWYYVGVGVDPASGKKGTAQIVWGNNAVDDVNFP